MQLYEILLDYDIYHYSNRTTIFHRKGCNLSSKYAQQDIVALRTWEALKMKKGGPMSMGNKLEANLLQYKQKGKDQSR